MHVLITGGAGFLGARLAKQLLHRGTLAGIGSEQQTIDQITLLDVVPAANIDDPRVRVVTGDIADPHTIAEAFGPQTLSVFHLAAVVSSQAEADFDLGMKVNFDATRLLLERARALGKGPRVVVTSSVAVFGGALPDCVVDSTAATPQSSYGTQKAMGRIAGRRLQPARVHRWTGAAHADRLGPARSAEQGGFELRQWHHP